MSFDEHVYGVLVVSPPGRFLDTLFELLPASRFSPVASVSSVSSAKRMIAERDFDLVIINSPLPDDTGVRFASDVCASKSSVVLITVRSELYSETYEKSAEYGVFVLSKPTTRLMISTALDWMAGVRERLKKTEIQTHSVESKIEEIRLVNKAKWLLIRELKMDEPTAHRYIEKLSMDRCVTKKAAAEEIIKTYM